MPAYFSVIIVVNRALAMVTLPFGVNLFAACYVAKLPIEQLVRPLLPLVGVVLACLTLITRVPQISLYFNGLVYGRTARCAASAVRDIVPTAYTGPYGVLSRA